MEVLTSAGDENRHDEADLGDILYPPKDDQKFKVMVQYILKNTKLPVVLPEQLPGWNNFQRCFSLIILHFIFSVLCKDKTLFSWLNNFFFPSQVVRL